MITNQKGERNRLMLQLNKQNRAEIEDQDRRNWIKKLVENTKK